MRGKLNETVDVWYKPGITPAHAGKTLSIRHPAGAGRDHPRACGENCHRVNFRFPLAGSPPRMRGKRVNSSHTSVSPRITPAHAGKTVRPCERQAAEQDHPRACGENSVSVT